MPLTSGVSVGSSVRGGKSAGRYGVATIAEGEQPSSDPSFCPEFRHSKRMSLTLGGEPKTSVRSSSDHQRRRFAIRRRADTTSSSQSERAFDCYHPVMEPKRIFANPQELIYILRVKVGRLVFNGYPRCRSLPCDDSRRPSSRETRLPYNIGGHAGHLSIRTPRLLPGFSKRRATRRIEEWQSTENFQDGGRPTRSSIVVNPLLILYAEYRSITLRNGLRHYVRTNRQRIEDKGQNRLVDNAKAASTKKSYPFPGNRWRRQFASDCGQNPQRRAS